MPKTPTYRNREGRSQALGTLTDSATKRRRDFWLGEHGTAESRELYHRDIAEWEANGWRFPTAASLRVSGRIRPDSDGRVKTGHLEEAKIRRHISSSQPSSRGSTPCS